MIKSPRGTRDLLPPDTALWNFVEATVRDVFRAYNFHEIRTPIFESTELFARGVGEETDIVSKEMFTWEDRPQVFEQHRKLHSDETVDVNVTSDITEGRLPPGPYRPQSSPGRTQSLTLRPENTAGVVRA